MEARPRTRAQSIFFVLMSTLALVSLLFSCQALYVERHRIASGYGDYVIFYTGAQIVRDGAATQLYDLNRQREYQDKFNVPIRAGALPFNHPAYELLWHIPLTFLSYIDAYIVWNMINVGLLLSMARGFLPRNRFDLRLMFLFMMFGFYPVLVVFLQGQDSILLTFLIGAAFIALKQHNEVGAGVLLGLASFKPQLVLPIVLACACKPYQKTAAAWLASVTVLGIISVSMVGISGAIKYLELISWIDKVNYTINPALMPNLRGLVHYSLAAQFPAAVFPVTALLTLGVLGCIVGLWRRARCENETIFDLTFALTSTLTLLSSYHAYTHDFALLLLPALIVTRYLLTSSPWGTVSTLLFVIILTLWIPFPLSYGQLLQKNNLAWGSLVIIAFALLLAMQLKFIRPSSSS